MPDCGMPDFGMTNHRPRSGAATASRARVTPGPAAVCDPRSSTALLRAPSSSTVFDCLAFPGVFLAGRRPLPHGVDA